MAGDTAGSSLRRLNSLQHRIYNLLGHCRQNNRCGYNVTSARVRDGPSQAAVHVWSSLDAGLLDRPLDKLPSIKVRPTALPSLLTLTLTHDPDF